MDLDAAEIGAYVLLLIAQWNRKGKSLPNDRKKLRLITRTGRNFDRVWASISKFFEEDENGVFNVRCRLDATNVAAKSKVNSQNGALGGHAKALKSKERDLANATKTPKRKAGIPEPEPYNKDTSNEVSPIFEAKQLYNIAADFNGWPKVMKMNKQREAKLRARLKDCGGLDGWQLALEKAGKSDFLCNRANKRFSASFDFLLQESSFTKLMEGNYDNRPGPNNGASFTGSSRPGRGTSEAFATVAARMSKKPG